MTLCVCLVCVCIIAKREAIMNSPSKAKFVVTVSVCILIDGDAWYGVWMSLLVVYESSKKVHKVRQEVVLRKAYVKLQSD